MCGICGKFVFDTDNTVNPDLIARMMHRLRHRGPDGQGSYVRGPIGLGHTRLSIIDVETGQQPLSSEDGQIQVVFNGEIYNFKDLRQLLQQRGHRFKTASDTEVIVHLYEEFGDQCVQKLRGMFSFALWDARRRRLLLARDRLGIKPLYYAIVPDGIVFGSEIKALLLDAGVSRDLNPVGLQRFLNFLYTPGAETLLNDVKKLEPGHYLSVEDRKIQVRRYWDLEFPQQKYDRGLQAATTELRNLLEQTVADHMISDVPIGVLLSGGVDSSGVLAIAASRSAVPLQTFTVGFDEPGMKDERDTARHVARMFRAEHHEITITAQQFRDFLPDYIWHMEEPICEPPAVALFHVAQYARQHVKVVLSGEGGDEAFAGYSNYRNLLWVEKLKRVMPKSGRYGIRRILELAGKLGSHRSSRYSVALTQPIAEYYYSRTGGPRSGFNHLKHDLYSPDFYPNKSSENGMGLLRELFAHVEHLDPLSKMLYLDTKTWLPDDLLIKADKMTMATSVELRVPLLDHSVLEFAAALPATYKIRGFTTKFILKKALSQILPDTILNRKKRGFPIPYESWLAHDLKQYVRDVITDPRSLSRGYFRPEGLRNLFGGSSSNGVSAEVFSLLVLELWHRQFIDITN